MVHDCYIGLGSNLSDPRQQIDSAMARIAAIKRLELINYSSVYESAPMGPPDQANFLNAVAHVQTSLTPLALLGQLADIEQAFGRDRSVGHWGPRIIDLDLLLFGQREIKLRRLEIPHPGLMEREFVVFPLLEIAPNLRLPNGCALHEIAKKLDRKAVKRL